MNDSINITYTPATGDLLLTTARQTSGLDDAIKAIGDFIRTLKAEPVKRVQQVKAVKKPRKTRALFNDQQKADIIARYKAGEGPKAISESLGCARSTIIHLIKKAGATEGRTGKHLAALNKSRAKQPEPAPEEPV